MGNIINETVFSDCVNKALGVNLKMAGLAYDATAEVGEVSSWGNKVSFPRFNRTANVATIVKGTAIVPADVDMADCTADILQTGGSIRVFDKDAHSIKGATLDRMAEQLAQEAAKDIDSALSTTADREATLLSALASANDVTEDEMLDAMQLFNDQQDVDSYSGICINSRMRKSFVKMDAFTSTEKTYMTNGNGIVKNGCIGYFMGVPVVVSDNGTYDTAKAESKIYFLKKGALAYVLQQSPKIEEQREGLLLATDIIDSQLYATKVLDTTGIVIARKTIA